MKYLLSSNDIEWYHTFPSDYLNLLPSKFKYVNHMNMNMTQDEFETFTNKRSMITIYFVTILRPNLRVLSEFEGNSRLSEVEHMKLKAKWLDTKLKTQLAYNEIVEFEDMVQKALNNISDSDPVSVPAPVPAPVSTDNSWYTLVSSLWTN